MNDQPGLESGGRIPDSLPPPATPDTVGLLLLPSNQHSGPTKATWPSERIPVEIFEIITSHLSRFEVRSLRLVCSEFEAKVSAQYFRNVVVPFKSELYSSLARDETGALKHSSSALFSNGMRIFQSFGPHILRFALSLELDEETLSYPPIKPSQEIVPTFWGLYRWPHGTYHRYTDLEGLEQTADETDAMKEALKYLVKVTNLGLCCDAGLGFLSGPDPIARNATIRHPVFATQNWRRSGHDLDQRQHSIVTMSDIHDLVKDLKKPVFENPISFKRTILQKMAVDAGYQGEQVNEVVQMVLDGEGTSLSAIDFDERMSRANEYDSRRPLPPDANHITFDNCAQADNYPLIPTGLTRAQKEMLLELEWAHRAMIQSYVIGLIDNALDGNFTNLTTLTIAKIPSSHVYIFHRHELWQNLPTLTNVSLGVIADWRRITKPAPSCILDVPISPVEAVAKVFQLLNSYIGAQPNIESLHFEWICGGEFAPGTFQRNHYVLPAPFFQQPDLMVATDSPVTHSEELLSLPFVKHLSLKNCWASPHVFLQTLRNMALSSLEKLELESVSLSGPPTTVPQAPLQHSAGGHNPGTAANLMHMLQFQAIGGQIQNHFLPPLHPLGQPQPIQQDQPLENQPLEGQSMTMDELSQHFSAGQAASAQQPLQADNTASNAPHPVPLEVLKRPDWLCWVGIIEHFSPGNKIRDILAREEHSEVQPDALSSEHPLALLSKHLPQTRRLHHDEKNYKLKCLSFRSCGYVSVDATFLNTRSILPFGAHGLNGNSNPHGQDYSLYMQRCRDKMLGRITSNMTRSEVFQLVNAFGMDIGWTRIYDEKTIADAIADGVEGPGRGRFSGTIDACGSESREMPVTELLVNGLNNLDELGPFG
ncbi:hypothetical protein AK830_g3001 [Neonectria ditissima]|uniref:F-box domain-containing protein n=1 Tax=Neonectria ditissima TaxID=78410 RepID=A0A0P7B9U7_9HYPO|nr:hypothetical protein AK830_g3001 [Neonectria ditissima]